MKPTWLAAFVFILALGSASAQVASRAQWDDTQGQFVVEDGAKVLVGVDSEAYGQALVDLWNDAHPEAADAVRVVLLSSAEAAQKFVHRDWATPDVVVASPGDLLSVADHLSVLDGNLAKLVNDNTVLAYYQASNVGFSEVTVVPLTYRGLVFGWNQTLLKSLGYDVSVTGENLPRAFDTWEKIFALAQEWQTHRPSALGKILYRAFPLPLDSLRRGYFVATGNWSIFKEENPLRPGFEKPGFLEGLEFIRAAAEARIAVTPTGAPVSGAQMTSRGDELLTDESLPFGLVGTWLDVEAATSNGRNLQFSALPTWKGARLNPWVTVRVGAIDSETNFPSASAELLRLLSTKKGAQAIVDHTPFLPVVRPKAESAPDYSQKRRKAQMLAALGSGLVEPTNFRAASAENPSVGVLDDPAVVQVLQEVWDGTKTPAEAQKALVAAADQWTASNAKKKN